MTACLGAIDRVPRQPCFDREFLSDRPCHGSARNASGLDPGTPPLTAEVGKEGHMHSSGDVEQSERCEIDISRVQDRKQSENARWHSTNSIAVLVAPFLQTRLAPQGNWRHRWLLLAQCLPSRTSFELEANAGQRLDWTRPLLLLSIDQSGDHLYRAASLGHLFSTAALAPARLRSTMITGRPHW